MTLSKDAQSLPDPPNPGNSIPRQTALFLLLASSEQKQVSSSLLEVIEGLEAATIILTPDQTPLGELRAQLERASHLLIIAEPQCLEQDSVTFALGYAAGHPLPVFLFVPEGQSAPEYPADALYCHTTQELTNQLRLELHRWREAQQRTAAVAQLAERGIPVTEEGMALTVAQGKLEELSLFFQAGFPPDTRNRRGVPLLCIAVRERRDEIVHLLLERGADVNAVSRDRGNTALMDAAAENNPELVKLLLEKGAELEIQSKNGQSALVLAVGQKRIEIARLLLTAGADPELKDQLGMSARGYAKLFQLQELLLLMEADSDTQP